MQINWVEAQGFRGFKEPVRFELNKNVEIIGGNGKGKSSIMEVISFCLAGADKYGKERSTDRLMNQDSSELYVAVGFEIDGQPYEVERRAVKLKTKTEGSILINRMQSNQEQIDAIIGNRKHFLAAFLPKYFIGLGDTDARNELMSLLPIPRTNEVLLNLAEDDEEAAQILEATDIVDPSVFIKKENDHLKDVKDELLRQEGKEDEIKAALSVEIPDEILIDTSEIESVREAIKAIENARPKLIDLTLLLTEKNSLATEYKALQSGLKFDEHIIECDNCGHKINLNAEQEKKNEAITEQMSEIMEKGKKIAAEIEEKTKQNDDLLSSFKAANAETLNDLQNQLRKLEDNLRVTEQHNMRVKLLKDNRDKAKSRQAEVREEKSRLATIIENTEKRIKAAKAFNVKRCEIQMESISGILDRVSIRLFDVVKSSGEIKPVFKLEYEGKEVRVLSTSEEIRCFLEISELFRKLTKRNYPVFMDCAESIGDFKKPDAQLIAARFVKGQALTVKEVAHD